MAAATNGRALPMMAAVGSYGGALPLAAASLLPTGTIGATRVATVDGGAEWGRAGSGPLNCGDRGPRNSVQPLAQGKALQESPGCPGIT